jgi:hypothetical protein
VGYQSNSAFGTGLMTRRVAGSNPAPLRTVLLVPDADLGGVRIAEQILAIAPAARLIDIGELPRPASRPWPTDGACEQQQSGADRG